MEYQYQKFTGDLFRDFEIATQPEKWGIIRFAYMEYLPVILESCKKNVWYDANFLDWNSVFSPIERIAWDIIRSRPHIIMYPQFPVFNHFIDFANPLLKIGIELDGKEFHDMVKDRDRDKMLYKYGWKIFRASGSLSNQDVEDYETLPTEFDFEDVDFKRKYEDWMRNTITGLIEAISIYYFGKPHAQEANDVIRQTLLLSSYTRDENWIKSKMDDPLSPDLF